MSLLRLLALLAWIAVATPAAAELRQGFDVRVLHAPVPYRAGGHARLVYELMLTNVSREPIELRRIESIDAATGRVLAVVDHAALPAVTEIVGVPSEAAQAAIVEAGRVAFVYLQVDLAAGSPIPAALHHRIAFGQGSDTVAGGEIRVAARQLPRLGPPLRGGPWTAVYHPDLQNGHRRFVYATAGRALIPGRHAIDWMAADRRPGDGFGAEVLAVADGIVIAAHDGVPEPAPSAPRPRVPLAEAAGNYLAIDIGGGITVFYEHLAPGHAVRVGDRIVRGQRIARVGSTGSASRPHLHFHLASGAAPLGAEGLPYVLEGATIVGAFADVETASSGGQWTPAAPRVLGAGGDDLPPPNRVVRFD